MINLDKIIEIKGLTIGYKNNNLIENINLSVNKGDFIALIGDNGSGKSTLLRIISKLQKFEFGNIYFYDKSINSYNNQELAKILSFVSTEKIYGSDLSVYDILSFGRYPYLNWIGTITKEDVEFINGIIDKFALNNLRNRFYFSLSDGEKQKVMIARAFCQNTDIILLDEPTAFLDIKNKIEIISLLKDLCRIYNKTIIMSSHDINVVIKETDIMWLISDKKIIDGINEDLILSGIIENHYKSDKFYFSSSNGDISFKRNFKYKIGLEADSDIYYWTKNALEKNNFEVLCNKSDNLNVIVKYENGIYSWYIEKNNKIEVKFQKIKELLEFLKIF